MGSEDRVYAQLERLRVNMLGELPNEGTMGDKSYYLPVIGDFCSVVATKGLLSPFKRGTFKR